MAVHLPQLPFAYDAFEPLLSRAALRLHHDKHHRAHVEKVNSLIAGTEYDALALEDVIRRAAMRRFSKTTATIFNNAAQAWNHEFFWRSIKPGGGSPSGSLAGQIKCDFRSFERFSQLFEAAAAQLFGSGWVWLVLDRGKLRIVTTPNAETPIVRGVVPLLTCDVWEHAYYVDYQNRRDEYVAMFLRALANWDFAEMNLQRAEVRLAAE